jgi:mono/diheme cytochrome c family protein
MRWWAWAVVIAAACEELEERSTDERVEAILALDGDPASGEAIYAETCAGCHAESGLGVDDPTEPGIGENLTEVVEAEDDTEFVRAILEGEGEMPAFADELSDEEIADVLAYIHEALFAAE